MVGKVLVRVTRWPPTLRTSGSVRLSGVGFFDSGDFGANSVSKIGGFRQANCPSPKNLPLKGSVRGAVSNDCPYLDRVRITVVAYATVGEITAVLRKTWGEYKEPVIV